MSDNDPALIERLRNDAVYVEEVIPSKAIASAIAEHLRDAAVEIESLRYDNKQLRAHAGRPYHEDTGF
jgi:hypothetical protein